MGNIWCTQSELAKTIGSVEQTRRQTIFHGRHDGDLGVADPQEECEIERVIVAAIEKHARGDVEALACGIIEIAPTTGPTAGMRCRRDQ